MTKFSLSTLEDAIPAIFDQVQISSANHRKNAVALYKLLLNAATVTTSAKGGSAVKLTGEKAFGDLFIDMINRILVVKKGVVVADRVAKFVSTFVKYMTEKAAEAKSEDSEQDDDTPESRLVARMVNWLLQGFQAKEKNIRFRCVQIVGETISYVGELDESMYLNVRQSLMERVSDKESFIRSTALVGLSNLLPSEDPSELTAGTATISEVLLYTMCYDPSPEVRRAALLHTPVTPKTLTAILSRSRDVDPLTRKLLYSSVLLTKNIHPRALSISQREQLVKDGLGDREDAVRVAAGKMVSFWYDIVTEKEADIVEFLKLFDVVGPEFQVPIDALLSLFVTHPDTLYSVKFDETFWSELHPESALLARVFVEYISDKQDETRLESSSLPVVTEFAFYIQEMYNSVMELLQQFERVEDDDIEEKEHKEDEILNKAFTLGEMLKIAVKLDYADEIGRRKMFRIIRDMLAHELLPEDLIDPTMDVMKGLLTSERELVQVIVEVIVDLRDPAGDHVDLDGSANTATQFARERSLKRVSTHEELSQEEKTEADVTDVRCLARCISMLRRINSSFENNSVLEGIVADLILPAVKRREYSLRQKGLLGLGLCCMISKTMASHSLQLFLSQVQSSPEPLRVQLLQTVFDIFLTHQDLAKFALDGGVLDFLLPTFENETSEDVQVVICTGLAKMTLYGLVNDDRVLISLVFAYVSPATADNQELRQCLAYFLPVYCYSAPSNQLQISSIFLAAYYRVYDAYEQLEDGEEMITPVQFGTLFVDWTNPQKAAKLNNVKNGSQMRNPHVELVIDMLRGLYDEDRSADSRAILCQLIGKVDLPGVVDSHSLLRLNLLVTHLQELCPIQDKTASKTFDRFKARFEKEFSEALARAEGEEYEVDDELRDLCEYIGIDLPGREAKGKKRGHEPSSSSDSESSTPVVPSRAQKRPADPKDDSKDEDSDSSSGSLLDRPPRPQNQQGNYTRNAMIPVTTSTVASNSSEEDSGELVEVTITKSSVVTPKKLKITKRLRTPGKNEGVVSPVRKRRAKDSPDALGVFSETSKTGKSHTNIKRRQKSGDSDEEL